MPHFLRIPQGYGIIATNITIMTHSSQATPSGAPAANPQKQDAIFIERAIEKFLLDDKKGYLSYLSENPQDPQTKEIYKEILKSPNSDLVKIITHLKNLPVGIVEGYSAIRQIYPEGVETSKIFAAHVNKERVGRMAKKILKNTLPKAARAEMMVPGLAAFLSKRFRDNTLGDIPPVDLKKKLEEKVKKATSFDDIKVLEESFSKARTNLGTAQKLLEDIGYSSVLVADKDDQECLEYFDLKKLKDSQDFTPEIALKELKNLLSTSSTAKPFLPRLAKLMSCIDKGCRADLLQELLPAVSVTDLKELSLLPQNYDFSQLIHSDGAEVQKFFADLGMTPDEGKEALKAHSWLLQDLLVPTSEILKDATINEKFIARFFEGALLRRQENWSEYVKNARVGQLTFSKALLKDDVFKAKLNNVQVVEDCWEKEEKPKFGSSFYLKVESRESGEKLFVCYPAFLGAEGQRYYHITDCFNDKKEAYADGNPDAKSFVLSESSLVVMAQDAQSCGVFNRTQFDDLVKSSSLRRATKTRSKDPSKTETEAESQKLDKEWAQDLGEDGLLGLTDAHSLKVFIDALDFQGTSFGFDKGTSLTFDGGKGFCTVKEIHPAGTEKGGSFGKIILTSNGQDEEPATIPDFAARFRELSNQSNGVYRCPSVTSIPKVFEWLASADGVSRGFQKVCKELAFGSDNLPQTYSSQGQTEVAKYLSFGESVEKKKAKGNKNKDQNQNSKTTEKKENKSKNATSIETSTFDDSLEILAIEPNVGIKFIEGSLKETRTESPADAEQSTYGITSNKDSKKEFKADKSKKPRIMRPWEFAQYMRERATKKETQATFHTKSVQTEDQNNAEENQHGGIVSMFGKLVKQGPSIASFIGGAKLISEALKHEFEQYSDAKAAGAAEQVVGLIHLDKFTTFGHEVAEEIRLTAANKTKKITDALQEKIDKLPARKKHQRISEILHNPASPPWEVRAALMAQVKGYGVLYNDASLSANFGKDKGYSHLEGTLMWYKKLKFRYADRWLKEYRENQAKRKLPFDERELISEAAKKEYGEKHVLAGFWKGFQKTVDEGVQGAEKKMADDCARMTDITVINKKILDKFKDKEYAGGFKGLERAWNQDSNPLEINRIPFIMAFGGVARELWAMENGIRDSFLKHNSMQDFHRIPALKYIENEDKIREFQNLVLKMARRKVQDSKPEDKKSAEERVKKLEGFFAGSQNKTGEERTKHLEEMDKFWTSDGQAILDMLLLKDSTAHDLVADENDTPAKEYVKTCDSMMRARMNLKESFKWGYNDFGNSLTLSPGKMYEEAIKNLDERRGDDTNFALSKGILTQFEKWFEYLKKDVPEEIAKREYQRLHRVLLDTMVGQQFSIKSERRNLDLDAFWKKIGLFSGMDTAQINAILARGTGNSQAPTAEYSSLVKRDEMTFFKGKTDAQSSHATETVRNTEEYLHRILDAA